MKAIKNITIGIFFTALLLVSNSSALYAQFSNNSEERSVGAEVRPFDFSDKFYEFNGVIAGLLADRRNGADGRSVFDFTSDPHYRGVRITETFPAYGPSGEILYWNAYAGFDRDAFVLGRLGDEARLTAEHYPIFVFPSTTVRYSDRQTPLIETDDAYHEKNPLGLGVVVLVNFTREIYVGRGPTVMENLLRRNGASLDGTPIIRTAKEIGELTRAGYLTQTFREVRTGQAPFMAARVITAPTRGAIAPDAFLNIVKQENGRPLAAETGFVDQFNCLQRLGEMCSKK